MNCAPVHINEQQTELSALAAEIAACEGVDRDTAELMAVHQIEPLAWYAFGWDSKAFESGNADAAPEPLPFDDA